MGAIGSSAKAGTVAQDKPNITLTTRVVTVERTSMHKPRWRFRPPAQIPQIDRHTSLKVPKRSRQIQGNLDTEEKSTTAPMAESCPSPVRKTCFSKTTTGLRNNNRPAAQHIGSRCLSNPLHGIGVSVVKELLLPPDLQLCVLFVTEAVAAMHGDREFISNGLELPVEKFV